MKRFQVFSSGAYRRQALCSYMTTDERMQSLTINELETYAAVLLESFRRRAEMTADPDSISDNLLQLYSSIMDKFCTCTHKEKERIALVTTLELKHFYEAYPDNARINQ